MNAVEHSQAVNCKCVVEMSHNTVLTEPKDTGLQPPQLSHQQSQQSVSTTDDYYSVPSEQSSVKSSGSQATVVRYATPRSHLTLQSAQQSKITLAEPQQAEIVPAMSVPLMVQQQEQPSRPDTSSTVRANNAGQPNSSLPQRHASAPTPGVDDGPYIRFAIDQLTRDEEVMGAGRWGSVDSTEYPVERIVGDGGLGYYTRTGQNVVETGRAPSIQRSFDHRDEPKEAVYVAVDPAPDDSKHPPLDYVPLVLQWWALSIYIFLVLLMIAGVVFSNVWAQRHGGLWNYDGVGGSRYFVVQYLPQLLGGFLIIWSFVVQAAIYRTVPFCIMASERQIKGVLQSLPIIPRNFLVPDLVHFRYGEPVVGFSLLTMWLTNLFSMPLLSCLYQTKFYNTWRWTTVQGVGWCIVALYGFLTIGLALLLARFTRSWTGLLWDPVSLADLIPLIQRSNILGDFDGSEMNLTLASDLPQRVLRLGYWRLIDGEEIFYGIGEEYAVGTNQQQQQSGQNVDTETRRSSVMEDPEHQSILRKQSFERHLHSPTARYRWTVWYLRDTFVLAWIVIVVGLFIAFVVVSFVKNAIPRGFEPLLPTLPGPNGFSASNFLYSFIPALIGTVLFLVWQPIDVYFRAVQPFASLTSPGGASAETSLLLSYPADLPIVVTVSAFIARHYKVGITSLMSVLSLAIPVLAGGIFIALWYPQDQAVRISAHLPGYYVLIAACALYTLAYAGGTIWPRRRRRYLPHGITTLADLVSFLHQSPLLADSVLREPRVKTDLVTRLIVTPPSERAAPRYGFGIYRGRDGRDHLGIDRVSRPGSVEMVLAMEEKNPENPKV